MKIDKDLRAAISAVIKTKTAEARNYDSWNGKKRAVESWMKTHPKEAARIAAARKQAKALREKADKLLEYVSGFGISQTSNDVRDETKFIKAGGEVPVAPRTMSFDSVMSQLAAADEKEGAKILKGLGIAWV